MQPLFPAATATDASAAAVSLAVYLAVAAAALASTPRDVRARLFGLIALANVTPYAVTIASWRGVSLDALPRWFWSAVLLSVGVGTVALFHFTQVFPWRRPWIARSGRWIPALYAAVALAAVALMWTAPADLFEPPIAYVIALLIVGVPWLFVVLVALPFSGLFSLFKSAQDAARLGMDGARRTTVMMLVSQLAGGVLAIVVIPLLRTAAPGGRLITGASLLLTAFGLLMPVAFALAAWRYRLLAPIGSGA